MSAFGQVSSPRGAGPDGAGSGSEQCPAGSEPSKPAKGIDVAEDVLAAGAFDQPSSPEFGQDAAHVGAGAATQVGEVGLGEAPVNDRAVGRWRVGGLGGQAKEPLGHPTP
jgi:hypothetical protein